ncbi:GTP-binding protein [Ramlibacter sp. USB13]|uniref:GTP-binding protein n=1 Tax=Ramlibacter cellulosilyticus TaxID=2764187 RepID=A0A923MR17_9BURK|nr:GTP-binding protein [Ramlibacter cellulosilyticus]MBC5782629.1 GTP-binding protein [Ramlibacter cellulosilyticus]
MKIRSIRLEGFKRFRQPLALETLAEGINLIAAGNGKGKSTLAQAVRVGFLERHRTASLGETLAPWSQPGANPSVQIEFLREGKRFRLAKTFGAKKSCTLEIEGAKPLSGDDAEQALADMFAFSYAGRGESKAENQGVPGLLWVQQGSSGQIAQQVEHAHDYIRRALGDDLGELAATAGDRVIDQVAAELAVLQTKTGKPAGDHARGIEQLAASQQRLEQLRTAIADYESAVDRFTQLRDQHAMGERDQPWQKLRAQAEKARLDLQAIEQLAGQRQQLELQRQVAASRAAQCVQELQALEQEEQAAQDRERAVAAANEEDARTHDAVRVAEVQLRAAQDADTAARDAAAAARRAALRRGQEDALRSARQRQQELAAQIATVEGQQQQLIAHQAAQARLQGFAGAGKSLRAAESRLSQARAKLEAVSTRVEYALQAEGIRLDGKPLAGSGSVTVSEPVELAIPGFGSIRVLPGANELSQLRADLRRAEDELQGLLQGFGAESIEQARQGEDDLQAARSRVEQAQALLRGLAPAGLEPLRSALTVAAGEATRYEQSLAALPADDGPVVAVEAAEAREKVTQEGLRAAQRAHESAREQASRAQEQLRLATRELDAARARLQAPGRDERRSAAQRGLVAARAEEDERAQAIARLDEQLQASQPEHLRNDIRRWNDGAAALEAAHGRIGAELHQLAGQLEAKGALGLQEQAATLEEEVARLQRQVDDRTRRAAALSHLLEVLTAKRAEVARGLRAPLQKHLNHYLAIQFPGASIELDEALRPARISRSGAFGTETGRFEELSGGEREQLGIIARLAYADLLKEAGKPTLVMLDDSLVNSDHERLARMKRVLYDAAQRHQILIFTCHQENWLDMGVAPIALQ